MRKKIKELMNKEEGFTLVELLAVIVILGIIVAIAIPAIGGVISRAQDNSVTAENALVEDAARLYVMSEDLSFVGGKETVTAGVLRDLGYLEDRDSTEAAITGTVTITETKPAEGADGAPTYEYVFARGTEAPQ